MMGERGMPSHSQSFPSDLWNLSAGEMNILVCLMHTVSGQRPCFPALHQQEGHVLAAKNTGGFSPLLFFKQGFQLSFFFSFFGLFFVELSCGHSRCVYIHWLRITQMTLEGNLIFPAGLFLDFYKGKAGNNNTVTLASGLQPKYSTFLLYELFCCC